MPYIPLSPRANATASTLASLASEEAALNSELQDPTGTFTPTAPTSYPATFKTVVPPPPIVWWIYVLIVIPIVLIILGIVWWRTRSADRERRRRAEAKFLQTTSVDAWGVVLDRGTADSQRSSIAKPPAPLEEYLPNGTLAQTRGEIEHVIARHQEDINSLERNFPQGSLPSGTGDSATRGNISAVVEHHRKEIARLRGILLAHPEITGNSTRLQSYSDVQHTSGISDFLGPFWILRALRF